MNDTGISLKIALIEQKLESLKDDTEELKEKFKNGITEFMFVEKEKIKQLTAQVSDLEEKNEALRTDLNDLKNEVTRNTTKLTIYAALVSSIVGILIGIAFSVLR